MLKLCLASHNCSMFAIISDHPGNVNEHIQQVHSKKDLKTAPQVHP